MNAPLLRIDGLGKRFGGFIALQGVSFDVSAGERLGLIGPNGSGKSTFVNCLGGAISSYDGAIAFEGAPLDGLSPHRRAAAGLARTFQLPRPFLSLTVLENVAIPLRFLGHAGASALERALAGLEDAGLADKALWRPRELTQVDLRRVELAPARSPAGRNCSSPTKPWRGCHTRRSTGSWNCCFAPIRPGSRSS